MELYGSQPQLSSSYYLKEVGMSLLPQDIV